MTVKSAEEMLVLRRAAQILRDRCPPSKSWLRRGALSLFGDRDVDIAVRVCEREGNCDGSDAGAGSGG